MIIHGVGAAAVVLPGEEVGAVALGRDAGDRQGSSYIHGDRAAAGQLAVQVDVYHQVASRQHFLIVPQVSEHGVKVVELPLAPAAFAIGKGDIARAIKVLEAVGEGEGNLHEQLLIRAGVIVGQAKEDAMFHVILCTGGIHRDEVDILRGFADALTGGDLHGHREVGEGRSIRGEFPALALFVGIQHGDPVGLAGDDAVQRDGGFLHVRRAVPVGAVVAGRFAIRQEVIAALDGILHDIGCSAAGPGHGDGAVVIGLNAGDDGPICLGGGSGGCRSRSGRRNGGSSRLLHLGAALGAEGIALLAEVCAAAGADVGRLLGAAFGAELALHIAAASGAGPGGCHAQAHEQRHNQRGEFFHHM